MPNWCATSIIVAGSRKEIDDLYKTMKGLEQLPEPGVPNGFGSTCLACLANALGKDYKNGFYRGEWSELAMSDDGTLFFRTDTAWGPSTDIMKDIQDHYPTLKCFFSAEEPGYNLYMTNDREGIYFKDRIHAAIDLGRDGPSGEEYFPDDASAYEWLEDMSGRNIASDEDISKLNDELAKDFGYCVIHRYEIVDI